MYSTDFLCAASSRGVGGGIPLEYPIDLLCAPSLLVRGVGGGIPLP